jgi:hypothetical protein
MIIYNPLSERLLDERIKEVEALLNQIPAKHCFITGSFLFKKEYNDIDIFVITRKKLDVKFTNNKAKLTTIDFNDLYSLFYHSISKSCISKNILPTRPLKVTLSDYWSVINEAIPTILNRKDKFHKDIRFLVLYTEYFKTGNILDSFQLNQFIANIKNHKKILEYVKKELPEIMKKHAKRSYIKRFFYTQAGYYKDTLEYPSQKFLYELTHLITKGAELGES